SKEVNQEIRAGQYFFIDILREGVLIYNSKRYELAKPRGRGAGQLPIVEEGTLSTPARHRDRERLSRRQGLSRVAGEVRRVRRAGAVGLRCLLSDRASVGGTFRVQVRRRNKEDDFFRVYAGEGPAWSEVTKAWVFAVNDGRSLRIADDEAGS